MRLEGKMDRILQCRDSHGLELAPGLFIFLSRKGKVRWESRDRSPRSLVCSMLLSRIGVLRRTKADELLLFELELLAQALGLEVPAGSPEEDS